MTNPTINELAQKIVEKGGTRKEDIMQEYGINRFEAHSLLNELVDKGVITLNRAFSFQKESGWLPATVSKEACNYLGIDISKIDFSTQNLKTAVDEALDERKPKTGLGLASCYNPMFFPVDGNKTRMLCGDLKTGDRVCYYTQEEHEHQVYGWKRTDSLGYEFCYNGRRDMSKVDGGTKYEWKFDETQNGWGVGQMWQDIVTTASRNHSNQYLPIPSELLGKPLVNMDFTFAERRIGVVYNDIPDTVKSARGICYNSYIHKTPELPEGIENAEMAFAHCFHLEEITKIPSTIKPENATDMFYKCSHLPHEELEKLPEGLRVESVICDCGSALVSDNGVLRNDVLDIDTKEQESNNRTDMPIQNNDEMSI